MLGRANKEHAALQPKPDLAKQLFPSSSPAQNGNIAEQFKKGRQSTQSIGGFAGVTNYVKPAVPSKSSVPLRARSPNIKQAYQRGASLSSTASTTRSSVFSRADSFQNSPEMIDLTDDKIIHSKPPASSHEAVHFDENDFDDDEDLDLDFELPMSMPAPPRPTTTKNPAPSPYSLPQLPRPAPNNPASSAQTWSSSSPSHRLTPPGALKRRQEEQTNKNVIDLETVDEPRPAKRRTLPWVQKRAEEDERREIRQELEDESASSQPKGCLRCNKTGHYTADCPVVKKGKATKWDFTPKNKDKHMPWNNTGSAIAEEKKKFKDKRKASRKADDAAVAAIEGHQKAKVAMAPITLSEEQQKVLDLVVNQNKSVFFTGSAGTGKSVLMRAIIADLRKKYSREPDRVAVTASTGLAACNIGGVTLHSFGGIGLGKEDAPTLVKKIKRNPKAKNRWLRTKILVIDEISMVDGDLFDKLETIARLMRNNGRPFGGIQLVITGDFFQLPPVPDYDSKARGVKFAFDAGTWATAIHHTIGLTQVFRQKDPVFANMLNEMRLGKITDQTVAAFKALSRPITYGDSIVTTELYVHVY